MRLARLLAVAMVLFTVRCEASDSAIRISLATDVESLDPLLSRTTEDGDVIEQIFETLTIYDPKKATPIPGTAERWEISKDLKTYTFHIRQNAKWSDGKRVMAKDFLYAWKRMLEPESPSSWAYQVFAIRNARDYYEGKLGDFSKVGIQTVGDDILRIELAEPMPYLLGWLSHSSMAPVRQDIIEKFGRDWTRPSNIVSNGAFVPVFREPKDKIILKKNPFYWDSGNVRLDGVTFYPIENENTALAMYDDGQLDIIAGSLPVTKLEILKKRKDIVIANYLGVYFYRFNTAKEPFKDPLVRRAFNLALDKRTIVEKVTKGGQVPATNFVPDGIASYRPRMGETYDPSKAKKLLAKAGYCAGQNTPGCNEFPRVEILFNTTANHKAIAEAVQAMLKASLGLDNIEIVNVDMKTLSAKAKSGEFQMARGSWIGDYLDPLTFLGVWVSGSGNNMTGWKNADFDLLIRGTDSTVDLKKRAELFNEAEEILNRDQPFLPIYFFTRLYLKKDHVRGHHPNILDKHPLKFVSLSK